MLSCFSFGEAGRGTGANLLLAERAKRMGRAGRSGTASGPGLCCWLHPLAIPPGDPQAGSAQSLREGMSVINGKGPGTIKGMSAFCIAKPT